MRLPEEFRLPGKEVRVRRVGNAVLIKPSGRDRETIEAIFEMWYGIKKSARPLGNDNNLSAFTALDVTPWPFEIENAEEAGDIRAAPARAGTPIGPYDILIAAQARRRGTTLVTANEREFSRVPGLKTEDWPGEG